MMAGDCANAAAAENVKTSARTSERISLGRSRPGCRPSLKLRPVRRSRGGGGKPDATSTSVSLPFKEQVAGIFDVVLDPDQELDRLSTVDDAMVVGERHVHHRPDCRL